MKSNIEAVDNLLHSAQRADGYAPFSEQFLLGLRDDALGHQHFVQEEHGQLAGVLALDGATAEMAVAPDHRRHGVGTALLAQARAALADAAEPDDAAQPSEAADLQVWAHGNVAAAQAFAAAHGMEPVRRLWVMEVAGSALEAAATGPAPEMTVANYAESVERWGKDTVDEAWLEVNNQAFSWHPEQGGWDLARLHRGMEAEWFDPADVILLWDETAGATPALAGFHWTKWHTEETPAFGEVYVVGLADAYRGRKLGGPLLRAGLRRMLDRGADRVILYVESDNGPAVKAYEALGFAAAEEHAVYR